MRRVAKSTQERLRLGAVRRSFLRRQLLRYSHVAEHALTPWLGRGMQPGVLKLLRELPSFPAAFRWMYNAPKGAWTPFDVSVVPPEVQTVPGIRRDPKEEDAAYAREPLRSFFHTYADTMAWVAPRLWRSWRAGCPGGCARLGERNHHLRWERSRVVR